MIYGWPAPFAPGIEDLIISAGRARERLYFFGPSWLASNTVQFG